ncbi:site-specific DNA-methyltransferase [Rhizobium leguminosarum bv. viciae]|nr:site-specific DNA-methyltransferase [Rhizobium leguminosarum bv. viciae]
MSRLTDLIAQAKMKDSALGRELEREFKVLSSRRSFGLNFERHSPESVELPGRPVRKGDKVRILPPRGPSSKGDLRVWKVLKLDPSKNEAHLELVGSSEPEHQTVAKDDLLVIADFKDYIYPGLVSTGKVQRGGDKPFHTVINGENFHALEALTFTHRGKIDAIYIDPPYNTGAKDWKYNNDYVESEDLYRHSKWLAFIERRLKVARELLDPSSSVLIATIDEKEFLRLGLLLEQTFPDAEIQMISSVINPKGTARGNEFARVDEYIFFVKLGDVQISRWNWDMLNEKDYALDEEVRWRGLARTGRKGLRAHNPGSWYPIYVNEDGSGIHSVGDTVWIGEEPPTVSPAGTVAIWPPASNGQQYSWSVVPETLRTLMQKGAVRTGRIDFTRQSVPIYYLSFNQLAAIDEGRLTIVGTAEDGTLDLRYADGARSAAPRTVWNMTSHDAGSHGTSLLRSLMPDRRFPFPKSLYAVEDALRFFVKSKPDAVVLDFFSGSGTTAHAVMRLNRQDGGRRQCISITNNEVGAAEQIALRREGLRPGDDDWEKWGICDYITKPRIAASITGKTPQGQDIAGDYKFADEFPIAHGFEENAEFFTLTYETPIAVSHNRAFSRISPILWMRAGSKGRRIETVPVTGWELADSYGLLVDLDQASSFCRAIDGKSEVRIAYIVTDDDRRFQAVTRHLPSSVEPVRLYESYLTNFRFSMGR